MRKRHGRPSISAAATSALAALRWPPPASRMKSTTSGSSGPVTATILHARFDGGVTAA